MGNWGDVEWLQPQVRRNARLKSFKRWQIFFFEGPAELIRNEEGQKGWECTKQYCSGPGKGGVEKLTSDWEIGPATSTQGQDVRPWDWTRRAVATETFSWSWNPKVLQSQCKGTRQSTCLNPGMQQRFCLCPRIWVSKSVTPYTREAQAHATPRYGVWPTLSLGYGFPIWDWYRHCFSQSQSSLKKQMQKLLSSKSTGNTIRNSHRAYFPTEGK